jgi:hypothetical protein
MKRLLALSWVAFAAVLVGCLPGASAWAGTMHQPWNWSGTLAAGRTLEVNGVNGSIVAAPGAGNRVLVSVPFQSNYDPLQLQRDSVPPWKTYSWESRMPSGWAH